MDIRINQRDTLVGGEDIIQFGGVRLEELPTGRDIVEEVLHTEVTTHRTSHGLLIDNLRTSNRDLCTKLIFRHARLQFHLGDSSNGGQRLSPETHRMKGKKVVCLFDLRSGMPLKGQTGIRR